MGRRPRVRIEAERPLLRAGLERLATSADLQVVSHDEGDADVVLRSEESPGQLTGLDVTLSERAVIVTCHATPPPELWEALGHVVRRALAD